MANLASPALGVAQDAVMPADTQAITAVSADPSAAPCLCVPALTPVRIMIDADLGSKLSKTGETFPLHLAEAIVVEGRELVAAGTIGQGEIVHAKKAGGSGAPGELVLAARFLTVEGRTLRLRSMRVALVGGDAINEVDALNAASAAGPLPLGLIGFAVTGRNVIYPKGTIAMAKTAEVFALGEAPASSTRLEAEQPPAPVSGQPAEH